MAFARSGRQAAHERLRHRLPSRRGSKAASLLLLLPVLLVSASLALQHHRAKAPMAKQAQVARRLHRVPHHLDCKTASAIDLLLIIVAPLVGPPPQSRIVWLPSVASVESRSITDSSLATAPQRPSSSILQASSPSDAISKRPRVPPAAMMSAQPTLLPLLRFVRSYYHWSVDDDMCDRVVRLIEG